MRQSIEDRTAAELAAAEALLMLACQLPQYHQMKATTIVTSTPYPKPPKKRAYIAPTEVDNLSIIYRRCEIQECDSLSPVSNDDDKAAVAETKPTTELTPTIPVKSNSGRIIKRTRRFISQSDDEEDDSQIGARKSMTPGKRSKTKVNKNTVKSSEEEQQEDIVIQPAKKIKIEPVCVVDEPKVNEKTNSNGSDSTTNGTNGRSNRRESSSKAKNGPFNSNFMVSIQSDKIRHSRLFESAHELQNYSKTDAMVEYQYRAAENLMAFKMEIDAKRNQLTSNRSPMAMALMQKFHNLKNRQPIRNEFASKFSPTESTKWKPFTEDANRPNDISNYKVLQRTNQSFIKFWIDQFVTQKHGKEKSRAILVKIIKMLPDRPEIRHEFINCDLPKLVSAHKQAIKKNKGLPVKSEIIDISAALPYLF